MRLDDEGVSDLRTLLAHDFECATRATREAAEDLRTLLKEPVSELPNPMPAWDHEIEWDGSAGIFAALPQWVVNVLNARMGYGYKVRVAAIRPADSGNWQAFETGDFDPDTIADNCKHGLEVRIGSGHNGCIERMKDFEGW